LLNTAEEIQAIFGEMQREYFNKLTEFEEALGALLRIFPEFKQRMTMEYRQLGELGLRVRALALARSATWHAAAKSAILADRISLAGIS
jgi:hypothetical protein